MNKIPRRSALYMPGSNARALEKAKTLAADVLIFDLEDAVAPELKSAARQNACNAARGGGYGQREIVIRTNGMTTEYFPDDFKAAAAANPDAILVPKIQTLADLEALAGHLDILHVPKTIRIWAMMETPLSILNAGEIAASKLSRPEARLDAFVMGTNDLAKETMARLVPGRAPMAGWLSICVAAARAYGLDILDGVYNNIGDVAGLRSECEQGRDFGMDGKTLIHPDQIAACNEIFSPQPAEVTWAKKILAAFEEPQNSGKGALQIDGRMVERLHAEMAQRVVLIHQAIESRGG